VPADLEIGIYWSKEIPPPAAVSCVGCFQMKKLKQEDPPWQTTPILTKFGLFVMGGPLPPGSSSGDHPKRNPPPPGGGGGSIKLEIIDMFDALQTLWCITSNYWRHCNVTHHTTTDTLIYVITLSHHTHVMYTIYMYTIYIYIYIYNMYIYSIHVWYIHTRVLR